MKKKGKKRIDLWILVLIIILAASSVIYFTLLRPGKDPVDAPVSRITEAEPPEIKHPPVKIGIEPPPPEPDERPDTVEEPPEVPEPTAEVHTVETREDECERIEQDVRDFLEYLDGQGYVRRHLGETDAWTRFIRMLAKLSQQPPVPAGEGLDPALMARNIFHLFRVLDDTEIMLTREVIIKEADTLELHLDIIYRWLAQGDHCPDPEGIRPSGDVMYQYAGFFMNTIGGRSYLFRRAAWLRILISYYSVMILHDADRRGQNSYGIDVLPMIIQVGDEISRRRGYYFQETYLERLRDAEAYYAGRRG